MVLLSITFWGCAESNTSGKIITDETLFWDFGTEEINQLFISKDFTFTNDSDKPLTIFGGNSSCGCTAGVITVQGLKSQTFSMNNPLKNEVMIPPYSDFTLTLRYEPGYHGPDFLGKRDQTLYFVSDSLQDKDTPTRIYPLDGKSALTEIKLTGKIINSTLTDTSS